MPSRRAMRGIVRSATWSATILCFGSWVASMGMSVRMLLWSSGKQTWTIDSSAGAFYLSNLNAGNTWNDPLKPVCRIQIHSINLISMDRIRWYPRYRSYGTGFTLAVPYWMPAVAIAGVYVFIPWLRPIRGAAAWSAGTPGRVAGG